MCQGVTSSVLNILRKAHPFQTVPFTGLHKFMFPDQNSPLLGFKP